MTTTTIPATCIPTAVWPGHALLEAAEADELILLTPAIALVRHRQADDANPVVLHLLAHNLLVLGDPCDVTWQGRAMTARRVDLTPRGRARLQARRQVLTGDAR